VAEQVRLLLQDRGLAQSGDNSQMMALLLGVGVGGLLVMAVIKILDRSRVKSAQREADSLVEQGRLTAEKTIKSGELEARTVRDELLAEFEKQTASTRGELKGIEKRLTKREDSLDQKLDTLSAKEKHLDSLEAKMAKRAERMEERDKRSEDLLAHREDELVRVSGMSKDEARNDLMSKLENELTHECGQMIDRMIGEAKEEAESRAREITLTAIQRYAADNTCEGTVSTVDIPSDDMKGRVIGREGRNIRAFEKATGVDVIVDDTPGVVVVSSFDPVRREVARLTLGKLIHDGRIHPGRIEEVVDQTRKEVEKTILETGKRASMEANVPGLHKKLIDLLGRLQFRTSYGQNVLQHSIEVAYLCQIIAEELGFDGRLARRCGLLHDIGKAVDHEVEGGHPQIGADICKRLNERPEVLNAVAGHHGDIESTSPYTPIVMAADAISAARPGGRRESMERYVQRLENLEAIATENDGVKQAYAIQAGRELRVIVDAGRVDDADSARIARDIAKRVETELTYPGEVKVTVLREMRSVEYAR
jgi:ribonucrease Y